MTQRRSEKGCLYSSLIKVIGYFRSVSRGNTFENFSPSFPLLPSHLCQPVSNRIEPEIIHRTSIPSRWMDNRAIKIARRFSCLKYSYTRINFKRSPPLAQPSIHSIHRFLSTRSINTDCETLEARRVPFEFDRSQSLLDAPTPVTRIRTKY